MCIEIAFNYIYKNEITKFNLIPHTSPSNPPSPRVSNLITNHLRYELRISKIVDQTPCMGLSIPKTSEVLNQTNPYSFCSFA